MCLIIYKIVRYWSIKCSRYIMLINCISISLITICSGLYSTMKITLITSQCFIFLEIYKETDFNVYWINSKPYTIALFNFVSEPYWIALKCIEYTQLKHASRKHQAVRNYRWYIQYLVISTPRNTRHSPKSLLVFSISQVAIILEWDKPSCKTCKAFGGILTLLKSDFYLLSKPSDLWMSICRIHFVIQKHLIIHLRVPHIRFSVVRSL